MSLSEVPMVTGTSRGARRTSSRSGTRPGVEAGCCDRDQAAVGHGTDVELSGVADRVELGSCRESGEARGLVCDQCQLGVELIEEDLLLSSFHAEERDDDHEQAGATGDEQSGPEGHLGSLIE
jgi:hypothetical protein